MLNKFSFWNGQPVTAPVYPQMGDIQQMNPRFAAGGYGGAGQWPGAAGAASSYGVAMHHQAARYSGGGGMPMHMQGMGDFRQMICPPMPATSSFFGQPQGQYEPCIENGEAFCAYNGMDTSIQGGGTMGGRGGGGSGGANGDFW